MCSFDYLYVKRYTAEKQAYFANRAGIIFVLQACLKKISEILQKNTLQTRFRCSIVAVSKKTFNINHSKTA
jgi:hypothetical protein